MAIGSNIMVISIDVLSRKGDGIKNSPYDSTSHIITIEAGENFISGGFFFSKRIQIFDAGHDNGFLKYSLSWKVESRKISANDSTSYMVQWMRLGSFGHLYSMRNK